MDAVEAEYLERNIAWKTHEQNLEVTVELNLSRDMIETGLIICVCSFCSRFVYYDRLGWAFNRATLAYGFSRHIDNIISYLEFSLFLTPFFPLHYKKY